MLTHTHTHKNTRTHTHTLTHTNDCSRNWVLILVGVIMITITDYLWRPISKEFRALTKT